MEISQELIERFLKKECTAEEAEMVARYLQENPAAMDAWFSQREFDETEDAETNSSETLEQWEAIQKAIKVKRLRTNIRRLAVAASVAGLISLGLLYWPSGPGEQEAQPWTQTEINDSWKEIRNNTNATQSYELIDGSVAKLTAGGSIRFQPEQWKSRRDIELQGEGVFYVTKDSERPFTVYCEEVSVRALGTVFSVRQQQQHDSMRVRLYEGKVLVRKQHDPHGKDPADLINPVTLKPGEEIVFGAGNDIAVRLFLKSQPATGSIAPGPKTQVPAKTKIVTGWVEFNNQPLNDLFGTLEVIYNVDIDFDKRDVSNIYFMGRFEPYDTIGGILDIIARLNNLTVEKTAAAKYRVRKIK